jgi:hypothetical protein
MFTMLFDINIVEKKTWGFLTKNLAFFAERLFLRARISILILFATTKAISDDEKNALNKSNIIRTTQSI